jgi:hypothetical protein
MELTSGGSAGRGPITFEGTGGTLTIDGTATPTNVINGFALGDTIDLTGVSFDSGGSATLESGNVLKIVENGQTYELQLNPKRDSGNLGERRRLTEHNDDKTKQSLSFDLSADKIGTNVVLDAPEVPALTIANSSPTVTAGGSVPLGIKVASDSDDAITVTISGMPQGFENVTADDGQPPITKRGANYTFAAADVNNGLTLYSSYKGEGHPVNALTITATNSTVGESASSAAKTITVTDPPATISPSYQGLALLNQFVAAGLHEQNGIPIVASSRMENNWGGEAFLTQPHH